MRVLDWLLRTAVLVVSVLATLALIGSLASVSNTPLGESFPGRVAQPPQDVAQTDTPASPSSSARGTEPDVVAPDAELPATAAEVRKAVREARHDASAEIARWLKALTYAVLALAGFAAAGMIALMRAAHHLGRIAAR